MTTSEGWKLMEKSQKYILDQKVLVQQKFFLEAVNRLKKTSDCIKIDPPGPGQNLKKKKKGKKKETKLFFFDIFSFFIVKTRVSWGYAPSGCTLRGAPPGPGPLELEGKKLGGKSVPENYIFFFFFVILPIKTFWNLSRSTDLVERIREQFFFIENWLEIVRVMTFFSTLHFIWFLLIFQFSGYTLPNRIWQAL